MWTSNQAMQLYASQSLKVTWENGLTWLDLQPVWLFFVVGFDRIEKAAAWLRSVNTGVWTDGGRSRFSDLRKAVDNTINKSPHFVGQNMKLQAASYSSSRRNVELTMPLLLPFQ